MPSPSHEDLSAYLDGELTDAEVAEIEAELARDPGLRAELATLDDVVQWMRRDGAEKAPLGFHRRIMDRIDAEHPPRARWWVWLRRPLGLPLEGWLVAAAAAAVLLLAVPRAGTDDQLTRWPDPPEGASPAVVASPDPDLEVPAEDDETLRRPTRPQAMKKVVGAEPDTSLKVPAKSVATVDAPQADVATKGGVAYEEGTVDKQAEANDPGPVGTADDRAHTEYRVQLRGTDPQMKATVLQVASRYTQAITDLRGVEVEQAAMASGDETIVAWLEPADLNAFMAAVSELGFEVTRDGDKELLGAGRLPVRIRMILVGGASNSAAPPVRAAKERAVEPLDKPAQ